MSDSSLEYDRGAKLPLYARHRVPECWIVDLNTHTLSRHREPGVAGQVELPGLGVSANLGSEPN